MKIFFWLLAISVSFSSSALAMSVLSSQGQDSQDEQENSVDGQSAARFDANFATLGTCNGNPDYYAELERLFLKKAAFQIIRN